MIEKKGYGNISRKTLVTLLLIIVSALLAVALFFAGAIWRDRVTARSAATDSRKFLVAANLAASVRRQSEQASGCGSTLVTLMICAWITCDSEVGNSLHSSSIVLGH